MARERSRLGNDLESCVDLGIDRGRMHGVAVRFRSVSAPFGVQHRHR